MVPSPHRRYGIPDVSNPNLVTVRSEHLREGEAASCPLGAAAAAHMGRQTLACWMPGANRSHRRGLSTQYRDSSTPSLVSILLKSFRWEYCYWQLAVEPSGQLTARATGRYCLRNHTNVAHSPDRGGGGGGGGGSSTYCMQHATIPAGEQGPVSRFAPIILEQARFFSLVITDWGHRLHPLQRTYSVTISVSMSMPAKRTFSTDTKSDQCR